ncbi:MAG TPA: Bax inhibitor-1/YccA family protein [Hyphomonadaceae bacterium]|jgi:FtsH-binding integral membrane protein|nr:Bax inhibitor-1/YccA family protein [Hyphomonadaceae bacterium]
MADYPFAQGAGAVRTGDVAFDAGLRKFMIGVYNKLFLGILLAGALAYAAGAIEPVTQLVFGTPLYYVVQWGPIVLLLGSTFLMRNPSPLATGILYWAIVTMIGLGMGVWVAMAESATSAKSGGIGLTTTYTTIGEAFFITASAFGVLSLWGYTSKKSLSALGSFAVMALWGVVAFSVLNLFLPGNTMIQWIIMGAVFVLSAILVASNTQQLKEGYAALAGDQRSLAVMTNWGALNFFISFVNMFRVVLMLLSSRN